MPDMFRAFMAQIRRIPVGKVATYGDVAYAAGYPGAARQVAWALHSSHGLPWHRVIGSGGKILCTGELSFEQRMRLQQEGVRFIGLRVAIEEHRFNFFGDTRAKGKPKPTHKKRSTMAMKAMKPPVVRNSTPGRPMKSKNMLKKRTASVRRRRESN